MTTIEVIELRTILDSRGNLTVEADIHTTSGFGRSAAPSGASTGSLEAKVKPPKEAVEYAVQNVIPALIGLDACDQQGFDEQLRDIDGTTNFAEIGANIAVALSLANAKAASASMGVELFRYLGGAFVNEMPLPLGNVIGGGAHAANSTEIQEFLVVPGDATDTQEAVLANAAVHRNVRELLAKHGKSCGKGDEGAWAPQIDDALAFELIAEATGIVADEMNISVDMGIDVAASQMWDGEGYKYREKVRNPEDQIAYIAELVDSYNLVYVEDPLHEDDFDAFAELTSQTGDRCLICGDDIFVTQVDRIQQGIEMNAANCVLIKPNQVGTLTDTHEAVQLAQRHGMETVMSHRSGETNDDSIAHLATAFGCIFLKTGVVGGERTAKLNELIRIEELI
jgi:enolase